TRRLVQTVLALTKVDDAGKEEEEAETDYLDGGICGWLGRDVLAAISCFFRGSDLMFYEIAFKEKSTLAIFRHPLTISLAFTVLSCIIVGVHVVKHWRAGRVFGDKCYRGLVCRILVVVPVSSVCSMVTVLLPSARYMGETVRHIYVSFALYSFLNLMISCLGGERRCVQHMEAVPVRRDYPPPLNWCLPPPQLDMKFLTAVRVSVLQFVFLKPLCAVAALLCSLHGLYKEGDLGLWAPFTWIFLVVHTSLSIAMYGLATFYWILQDLLEPYRPLAKFALIKLIVFLPWFQYTLVVAAWFMFGRSFSDDTYTTALVYEGLLECVELCLLACFFVTAYPVGGSWIIGVNKDYDNDEIEPLAEDGEREVSERLKSLLLPEDVCSDLPDTVGHCVLPQILHEALDVVTGG
ncbi:hypothetical protein FOZ63_033378, partial [Perkinsus olseni]